VQSFEVQTCFLTLIQTRSDGGLEFRKVSVSSFLVNSPLDAGMVYDPIMTDKYDKEDAMPYVNIKVTKEGVTAEQKARLIEGATKLLFDVLGENPQITFVVIDGVDTDNWGVGGEPITARRKRGK